MRVDFFRFRRLSHLNGYASSTNFICRLNITTFDMVAEAEHIWSLCSIWCCCWWTQKIQTGKQRFSRMMVNAITMRRYVIVTNCYMLSYALTWCRLLGICSNRNRNSIAFSLLNIFPTILLLLRFFILSFALSLSSFDIKWEEIDIVLSGSDSRARLCAVYLDALVQLLY